MKAVVCWGAGDYRYQDMPEPVPADNEVVVKVKACGICASDGKCFVGANAYWGGSPPYVKAPVIPGHEFIGEVMALGPGAGEYYQLKIGDKAVAEQILPCWQCRYCLSGKYWMCEKNYVFGFQGGIDDGGMAEYLKYPRGSLVHKVPADMPDKVAAMIEPLSCAIHAVQRGKIELGDTVVIAGMGPLGLCMLQVAKLKNPGQLIVLDARDSRLEVAKKLGADMTINVAREDAVKKVLQLTGGYGCDVYLEATGVPAGVIQGLQMIRKLGNFVEFSVMAEDTRVDWTIIGDRKELNIYGSHLGPYCYPLAIDYLYRGLVKVDDIVTHVFPLKEFRRAFEIAHQGLDNAIKVLLIP